MTGSYKGSCLCGSIRFEVDAFQSHIGNCHCKMCRKFHGAAFSTFAEVKRDQFRWTAGEILLKQYIAHNDTIREFCSECGSSLTFSSPLAEGESVEIALGCFDDELPVKPDAHIYIGSSANWSNPDDDLPQYEEWRDSERIK